jgi:hypothetical protein
MACQGGLNPEKVEAASPPLFDGGKRRGRRFYFKKNRGDLAVAPV